MRVHLLEIEAFGPFADRVVIDLDALSADGLFLIHGPTGSGKTSLLDAICFALYADVPGPRSKSGLPSHHARPGAVPRVVLELTAGARRLRITRSPEFQRPSKRGSGLAKEPASVTLEEHSVGRWVALSARHDEVADVVDDALGMGLAQFARVVLLPQGEFAAFLRATPEHRRDLLERLFDITAFSDVEQWLADTRREAGAEVTSSAAALTAALARFDDVLAEAGPARHDDLPLAGLPPQLVAGRVRDVADRLGERVTTTMTDYDAARGREGDAAAALARGRSVHERRTRGLRARAELAVLAAGATEHDERVRRLADADRAAGVAGHLVALERAGSDCAATQGSLERTRSTLLDLAGGRLADLPPAEVRTATGSVLELDGTVSDLTREVADATRRRKQRELLGAAAVGRASRLEQLAGLVEAGALERAAAADVVEGIAATAATVGELELRCASARDQASVLDAIDRDTTLVEHLGPRRDELRRAALDRRSELLDLRQRRIEGMAAELAGSLSPGEGCPVCGGVEHPAPARVADPVSPADVREAEATLALADDALAQIERQLEALRAGVEARRTALGGADRSRVEADIERADALLADARSAAGRHRAATERLVGLGALLDTHRRELAGLQATDESAAARIGELDAADTAAALRLAALREAHAECPCASEQPDDHVRLSSALVDHRASGESHAASLARLEGATSDLDGALAAAEFADADAARRAVLSGAETAALRAAVRRYDDDLAGARAVVDDPEVVAALGEPDPDLAALTSAARSARDQLLAAAAAQDEAARALRGVERLLPLLDGACARAVAATARDARVRELADTVGGTSPDNTMRMRLTAYVLAARLEKVAVLANERLAVMGGGRFALEHSDARATGRARSGLGLRVLDQWTGQLRDTATLSGGESFMASLALALGLADAVREETGGLDLGTLFIDEGFGSLDDDSLDEVLGVLDSLRAGGRAVGVVSHVADLRSRVTHQAVVHKSATGSSVEVRVGGRPAEPAA